MANMSTSCPTLCWSHLNCPTPSLCFDWTLWKRNLCVCVCAHTRFYISIMLPQRHILRVGTLCCCGKSYWLVFSCFLHLSDAVCYFPAVAEILLWRDEKKTFVCFLLTGFVYHWFFLSGNTFISSLAQLLLLTIVLLCGLHILPMTG